MLFDSDDSPDFVDSSGTKFWLDHKITDYAATPNKRGIALPKIACVILQTKDGLRTRLLFDHDQFVAESNDQSVICQIIEEMKKSLQT